MLGIRKSERIEAWVHMYRKEGELSFHKPNRILFRTSAHEDQIK